jgi:hypothetical protein
VCTDNFWDTLHVLHPTFGFPYNIGKCFIILLLFLICSSPFPKDLGDGIIFLRRTYSVNFKLDCKPEELLQEILKLGHSGVFSNITIALHIFVISYASMVSGEQCVETG